MTKTEAQTRSELIDQQLASAGWNVKDPKQVVEEFDILTAPRNGVAEPRTPYEGHQFRRRRLRFRAPAGLPNDQVRGQLPGST